MTYVTQTIHYRVNDCIIIYCFTLFHCVINMNALLLLNEVPDSLL